MEIDVWAGGLQDQEIEAINRIKKTFNDSPPQSRVLNLVNTMKDQLQKPLARKSMYPWKGYAGFRFVDSKGQEGEFDLIIVTHCNVLIIELKDWNHKPITSHGDIWFKGEKNMGRSPVSITRKKKFTLDNKLKKLTHRFSNKGYAPFVEFFVVMTGNADFSQLPEVELKHTLSLKDFLKLCDQNTFNTYFRPHPNAQVLNNDFPVFNELFGAENTAPKTLRIGGYTAVEEIFEHPNNVYKEYLATSEISRSAEALLRVWNFNRLDGKKAFTPEGRAEIVSREREILQYINHQNRDLYNHCLRSLTSFERDEVTSHYNEVYELPPGHFRFNEFIGKYGQSLTQIDRLSLAKLLLAKFGDLHEIKIAHRDIADHSLWFSPSKEIALSNFISAYHQPIGTVGDYRTSLSVGAVEVKEMLDGTALSPFQQDVHAVGLVIWHLLTSQRISPRSLDATQNDMLASDEWYAGVLLDAVQAKFANAAAFFDAIMRAEPEKDPISTFDDTELDPYRNQINHSRQFREDGEFLVETTDKEVYLSSGRLVKVWLNVGSESDSHVTNFRVLAFLRQLDKLGAVNPICLPRIHEYGLATKSGSMYLVTDIIYGTAWDKATISDGDKIGTIAKLIAAVELLHSLEITHGDIHPGNVILAHDDGNVFLVDTPDFTHNTTEAKNHLYSPDNIDGSSSTQRDVFAVLKMSSELLGIAWGETSDIYPGIAEVIEIELGDREFGLRDFGRFKKALTFTTEQQDRQLISITLSNAHGPLTILPDNGHLYVKVGPSAKQDEALVTFAGIGGKFSAFYSRAKRCFVGGRPPLPRAHVSFREEKESQFEMTMGIQITTGRSSQLLELSDHLRYDDGFNRAIDALIESAPTPLNSVVSAHLATEFENSEGGPSPTIPFELSTQALWRAILETETESSPNIELNGTGMPVSDSDSELILPYEADVDPLGGFTSTDKVEALLIAQDGIEKKLGDVSLKKSALKEVRLTNVRSAALGLEDGDTVFFRALQDRASYRKRKAALQKLLDREGVIPELMDLFDPACKMPPKHYDIAITETDYERYDREDQHGNRISLNEQQRGAFAKLLNYGPLSLLQGPPGTGKTEFIAAFVHFLIEKLGVRRILMVSQSHEAVNTAAERVRMHCRRLGTSVEVVRFSNREGAVSSGLKDVYSHALTAEKRELFNAECRYRVAALADAVGLEKDFVFKVVDAELRLFKQIDYLQSLLASISGIQDKDDIRSLREISIDLDRNIRTKLREEHNINFSEDSAVSEAKTVVLSKLATEYGVKPNEVKRVRAMSRICREMQDALSAENVNLDEFYARSRELVTGTCVGIGQGHMGIQSNIYDFVIIDEAARSISSELAIAMQAAKRVLLVGDHLQLPPLYSDAHKSALARRLGINNERAEVDVILRSDFARAFTSVYGAAASATLLTQYRMAPAIGNLVSNTFYQGKLQNGPRTIPDIYGGAPDPLRSPVTWLDTSSLGRRAHHESDRGVSIYNRCEAEQVIELLKQMSASAQFLGSLTELKVRDEALIGVICMYAEQKRMIRQKFNQEIWSEGFKELVKIDTVDSYQGKENRIIILSLTRSDPRWSPGFLRTPNRVNVAMSRAMDRLIVIGNSDMWRRHNPNTPLADVITYMTDNGERAGYRFVSAKTSR